VTVNDLIGEVLAVVRGELEAHQVSLRTELSDGLPTVLAAPTQLQQVLLNLIMNAIEARVNSTASIFHCDLHVTGFSNSGFHD